MSKALILVKSPKPETYKAIIEQLVASNSNITAIEWIYMAIPIDEALTVSSGQNRFRSVSHKSINRVEELLNNLKGVNLIDVTALPKELALQIFAIIAGHRNIKLCTATRDGQQSSYVDLTSEPIVASFRKSYFFQKITIQTIAVLIALSAIAYIAVKISGFDSNSPFIIWLGVFSTVLGIFLSIISLKK